MVSRLNPLLLAPLAALAVGGATPGRSDVPPAHVTGEPVSCVRLSAFNDTKVRDDHTIDFMRNGRSGWRNTLPQSCPGLRSQNAFTYKVSTGELCSVDIIYVLETAGGLRRGAGCGLGQFVPIELERRR
jgi:hypothetical protein